MKPRSELDRRNFLKRAGTVAFLSAAAIKAASAGTPVDREPCSKPPEECCVVPGCCVLLPPGE
jgi:hypothetical protein